jgi:hypothetical protein
VKRDIEIFARVQTMLRIQQQYLLTGTTPTALGAMSILREERRTAKGFMV